MTGLDAASDHDASTIFPQNFHITLSLRFNRDWHQRLKDALRLSSVPKMEDTKKPVTATQYHQHTCPLCEKTFACRRPAVFPAGWKIARIASERLIKTSITGASMIGNGTVEVENPAEVLRQEDGVFKVTSPYGQVFQVTCRKGRNMHVREIGSLENAPLLVSYHDRSDGSVPRPAARRWQIQKIA
jgi:hypothetical protein